MYAVYFWPSPASAAVCLSISLSVYIWWAGDANVAAASLYVGVYHRGFTPSPHFTLFIFPCLRVLCITERWGRLTSSGVGWDLINDAAQPVISGIITSLIQPPLSASPSLAAPLSPSHHSNVCAHKRGAFILPPSVFPILSRLITVFVVLFTPSLCFSFPLWHLCPSPAWIWNQTSEFFSLVVHCADMPAGRASDLSREQLGGAPEGQWAS